MTVKMTFAWPAPATPVRGPISPSSAGDLAMRLLPRFPGPIPRALPPEWL